MNEKVFINKEDFYDKYDTWVSANRFRFFISRGIQTFFRKNQEKMYNEGKRKNIVIDEYFVDYYQPYNGKKPRGINEKKYLSNIFVFNMTEEEAATKVYGNNKANCKRVIAKLEEYVKHHKKYERSRLISLVDYEDALQKRYLFQNNSFLNKLIGSHKVYMNKYLVHEFGGIRFKSKYDYIAEADDHINIIEIVLLERNFHEKALINSLGLAGYYEMMVLKAIIFNHHSEAMQIKDKQIRLYILAMSNLTVFPISVELNMNDKIKVIGEKVNELRKYFKNDDHNNQNYFYRDFLKV
jgi:hypothetical protein